LHKYESLGFEADIRLRRYCVMYDFLLDIVGRTDGQIERGLMIILYMCMATEMLTDGNDNGYLKGNTSKLPLGVCILMFSLAAVQNAWYYFFSESFISTLYRSDAVFVLVRPQVACGFGRSGVPRDLRVCLQIHMVTQLKDELVMSSTW
jgi:hypothetical protein